MAQDFATFRARSREVSAQSRATIRGTMVRNPDGHDEPWLKVVVGHPVVGSVMGWPGDILPVFQQPLCSLPVLAVATVLGMGELWLYDRQLRRVIPVAQGQRCMAVLVGSKHLARLQGDDAPSCVTAVLLSLPDEDDNVSTKPTLDAAGGRGPVRRAATGDRIGSLPQSSRSRRHCGDRA